MSELANKTSKGTVPAVFDRYPEIRMLYLKHLARYGVVTAAAAHCRVTPKQVEAYRHRHEDFAELEQQAFNAHKAGIEDAIRERAIEGVDEPRFGPGGMLVGYVKRFSDTLLLAYARRHIPEYREKVEQTGTVQHDHLHAHRVEVNALTAEQRNALRLLLGDSEEPEPVKLLKVESAESGAAESEPDSDSEVTE